MLKRYISNPVVLFLVRAALLLVAWFCLYEFLLNPAGFLDSALIANLIFLSTGLLRLLGFSVIEQSFEGMRTMGIDGTSGVWIGDPCNGISLFAVFTIILACFPGPVKTKLWYIPLCLLIIHLINVVRIAALALIEFYSPESLAFNHTYTFQVVIYGVMFLMWVRWVNKYSGIKRPPAKA